MIPEVATPPVVSGEGRAARGLSRLVARPAFWLFVVSLGFAVPLVSRFTQPTLPPLPVLGTLSSFSLLDEDGTAFGTNQLTGKVWVAGFIFTRCPTICPAITTTMGKIQKRARGISNEFRLVSFSVDPAFDTPEVLRQYATRYKASPRMWRFLTGPLGDIKATVVDGLKIAMGEPEGEQDFESIFHGTHFVLVDRQMRVRAYHDSSDPNVVDNVLRDAAMLLNRGD
ncbi:MAG: SCO family protein [Deltaproteobacteria bacterium]|nr:SCO family protein [Deltaproteobacteria bacterium]